MPNGPLNRVFDVVRRRADPDATGPLADERLLKRFAANGDPSAFELLVWRHGGLVLGTCRRLLRDSHLAEDAFQTTFLALARKPCAVRSGAALAGWLHRVAVRVANKLRTAEARRTRIERGGASRVEISDEAPGRDEWNAIIDQEVDRLPDRLRRTVVLCYLDGRTTDEAGQLLGCARGTILWRLSKARDRLRAQLTRRGVTLPAAGLTAFIAMESPAALVPMTVRCALVETPPVLLAIVHGVFHAMTISKLKVATAVVLAIGFAGTGVGWVVVPGAGPGVVVAEEPPPPPKTPQASATLQGLQKNETPDVKSMAQLLELMQAARKTLQEGLERDEQEYQEFRLKNPYLLNRSEGQNVYLTRLIKIEAKRSDLQIKKGDISTHVRIVRQLMGSDEAAKTILLHLNRRGVDVALLQRIGGSDSAATAVKLYANSLELELSELDEQIRSFDEMYEVEMKKARDMSNYEVIDEGLRRKISASQTLFESIIKRINEFALIRDSKK